MKLENLQPRQSKLYLASTGKEYRLRPWTLKDQIWMKQEYGDRVEKIFDPSNIDIVAIARMAYRLLADKSDFRAKELIEIDEEGNEIKKMIGGYKLMIHMAGGYKEQFDIFTAVLECVGMSQPDVSELKKAGDNIEKKSQ